MSMAPVKDPQVSEPEMEEDEPPFSHIVRKGDQMRAYIQGTPILALCGKRWVPSRDPEKYDICPTCTEVLNNIRKARHPAGGNN